MAAPHGETFGAGRREGVISVVAVTGYRLVRGQSCKLTGCVTP